MLLDLRPDNPFSYGIITTFSNTEEVIDSFRLNHVPSPKDKYHIVRYGDSLDFLAFDYYGNSKYWWVLFYVNNLENPFILETGKSLVIPDISIIKIGVL